MPSNELDKYLKANKGPARPRGCYICGEPTEAVVQVSIRERTGSHDGRSTSMSRSLCGEHALAVYEGLKKQITIRKE